MSSSYAADSTAADYADALLACRRARTCLVVLLLLAMVCAIGVFVWAKYGNLLDASCPAAARQAAAMAVALTAFLGPVVSIVLAAVLLVIVNIMLVGRLIGLSRVVCGFFWCVLLVVLLLPWQTVAASAAGHDLRVPGVLCTWSEVLALRAPAPAARSAAQKADVLEETLTWLRFGGWPVLAGIIVLVIHQRTGRGLRQALGEDQRAT